MRHHQRVRAKGVIVKEDVAREFRQGKVYLSKAVGSKVTNKAWLVDLY